MTKVLALSRLVVGAIFVYASLDKILHPTEFADLLVAYRLLPPELVSLVALVLPWLEFLCGVSLIFGLLSRSSALWTTLMSSVFLIAKVSALSRGLDISCGCFTVDGSSSVSWTDIPLNLGLLLTGVLLAVKGPGSWSLDERFRIT